jgi:hypothetical protein
LDNWRLVRGSPIPRNYCMRAAKNTGRNQLIFRAHMQDGLSLYGQRQNAGLLSAVCQPSSKLWWRFMATFCKSKEPVLH